eukprot:gnl/MRDRNA2_/MRDRNA2_103987_c0_seq1.p1 gnl/MRDRNA2_/MRDRNA2_103987_c0~~gnl/MRDRNA2_/MRDRNA2_103987_c0_seq1.p1  ORF type:complete len:484 (+),score=124.88 gnl/MRDRNA2_/MRDRNA2_103987_c0_seq1:209-1660(+)
MVRIVQSGILHAEKEQLGHSILEEDFANDTLAAVELLKSPSGCLPKYFPKLPEIKSLDGIEQTTDELLIASPAALIANESEMTPEKTLAPVPAMTNEGESKKAALDLSQKPAVLLEHVNVCSEDAQPGTRLGNLLDQVTELSYECFKANVVKKLREKSEQNQPAVLVLLGQKNPQDVEEELPEELLGFLVYECSGPPVRRLTIHNVAVPERLRGFGYGKQLTAWAMDHAKNLPLSECGWLHCSALPEAVPFYKRLGWEVDIKAEDERVHLENELPGQVYMQYKVRRRPLTKEATTQNVVLEHLDVHSEDAKSGTCLGNLLDDVRDLSWDCFSHDVVEKLQSNKDKNQPLLLVLIDRKELKDGEVEDELLGFVVYHLQGPPMRWLSIDLLAVAPHLRGLGHGKRLAKWVMNHAKQMPRSQCASVSCTSPPEAVAFYQKLGFEVDKTADNALSVEQENELSQPVFLKYKCGREVAKASAKRKSKK